MSISGTTAMPQVASRIGLREGRRTSDGALCHSEAPKIENVGWHRLVSNSWEMHLEAVWALVWNYTDCQPANPPDMYRMINASGAPPDRVGDQFRA